MGVAEEGGFPDRSKSVLVSSFDGLSYFQSTICTAGFGATSDAFSYILRSHDSNEMLHDSPRTSEQ